MDQRQDLNGAQRHTLLQLVDVPAFVKQASEDQIAGPADMPQRLFADDTNSRWPIHSAPATWMSALFLAANGSQLSHKQAAALQASILKQAEYFGVRPAVEGVQNQLTAAFSEQLLTLPDSDFMFVWQDELGNSTRQYPMRNVKEAHAAADYLQTHADTFLLPDRRQMARKLLNKVAAFGIRLDPERVEWFEKNAGYGMCAAEEVKQQLLARCKLSKRLPADERSDLIKLAEHLGGLGSTWSQNGRADEVADLLDELDRKAQLTHHYGQGLMRPEELVYGVTQTKLAEYGERHIELRSGDVYDREDLRKLSATTLRRALDTVYHDRVFDPLGDVRFQDLLQVLPTIPRYDAEVFSQYCGLEKQASGEAHEPLGLTRPDWDKLAELVG